MAVSGPPMTVLNKSTASAHPVANYFYHQGAQGSKQTAPAFLKNKYVHRAATQSSIDKKIALCGFDVSALPQEPRLIELFSQDQDS